MPNFNPLAAAAITVGKSKAAVKTAAIALTAFAKSAAAVRTQ